MVSRSGVALALALSFLGAACKKPPPPPDPAPKAPDHLGPREIPEGRDKAFALALPLTSKVELRFKDSVEVETMLKPEELVNFVRARVKTEKVTAGADRTTFEDAVVPSDPKRMLHIEIRPGKPSHNMRSSMIVRDVTPLPAPPKESEEEAYKRAGRGADGKPLDPNHMF